MIEPSGVYLDNCLMNKDDFIIKSRKRDLGGFTVYRAIPNDLRRHLGPFVFLDHMGPMIIDNEHALDVRPHPHIGLSTVTYLFEGRCRHRDSLGNDVTIIPGDLNLMTAGSGVVHSERTPREDRNPYDHNRAQGIQIWIALPLNEEERKADFIHYPEGELPRFSFKSLHGKILIGEFEGIRSPVRTFCDTLLMDLTSSHDGIENINFKNEEIGIFLVSGACEVNGRKLEPYDLIFVDDPYRIQLSYKEGTHIIIIGGEPFPEPRYIWWNFISSRKERIREAAADWEEKRFPSVPGETEFIPLPEKSFP